MALNERQFEGHTVVGFLAGEIDLRVAMFNFRAPQMQNREPLSHFVETYRFWDVAVLWGKERLEHEDIVARVLATAFVQDGLKIQSVDTKWVKGQPSVEFRGNPYVGFKSNPEAPMCVLRAEALAHLIAVSQKAEQPSRELLAQEFIAKEDFSHWAVSKGIALPKFWFGTVVARGL